jgi:hypothetical protein
MPQEESRSVTELFRDVMQDVGRIVRDEVQLAKAEFGEKTTRARSALVPLGAAIGAGLFCAACIVTACIAALALAMAVWLAAFITAVLLGGIGYFAYSAGTRKLKSLDPLPRQTIATVKQNIEWARNRSA